MENEKKSKVSDLMQSTIEKVHQLVDTNVIVGQPITTPDGVTLIPISRAGGGGAGVKIDPVAFLVIKDGVTRVLPVAAPPVTTVDRIIDMAPDLMDKAEKFLDKKKAEKEQESV